MNTFLFNTTTGAPLMIFCSCALILLTSVWMFGWGSVDSWAEAGQVLGLTQSYSWDSPAWSWLCVHGPFGAFYCFVCFFVFLWTSGGPSPIIHSERTLPDHSAIRVEPWNPSVMVDIIPSATGSVDLIQVLVRSFHLIKSWLFGIYFISIMTKEIALFRTFNCRLHCSLVCTSVPHQNFGSSSIDLMAWSWLWYVLLAVRQ